MKYWAILLGLGLFFISAIASAEYYKYRDKNGVLRFTDNMMEVPADQRQKVTTYEEVNSNPANESQPDPQTDATDDIKAESAEGEPGLTEEMLRKEKAGLDETFKNLENEKARLTEAAKKPRSPSENAAFLNQVKAYNEKRSAYQSKSADFQKKVDAYNAGQ